MRFFLRSISLLIFSFSILVQAQVEDPVKWTITSTRIDDNTAEVVFIAKILPKHHVYTHDIDPNAGPVPLSVTYDKLAKKDITKQEVTGKKITKYDDAFMADLSYYEQSFKIIHTLKTKENKASGTIDYTVCSDISCMTGSYDFQTNIVANNTEDTAKTTQVIVDTTAQVLPVATDSSDTFDHSYVDKSCFAGLEESKGKSLWVIFLLGFLGGLIALITPCVFPLIPMTVSYFTKGKNRSESIKNALLYGISIIGIYVLLGTLVTAAFGADALNILSTNVIFNVIFFLLFVVFALSFFGLFEITLPSSWSTKADALSFKAGYVGIFFMAFTLALVSFSCTGPIIGSLLVEAVSAGGRSIGFLKLNPLAGMFGFALALALPFTLFALFPQWLQSMPKSGGWLGKVKVILGFLELAFALKFLSVADLVGNWGILRWELFLVLWIIIFLLMGLYALNIFPFKDNGNRDPFIFKIIGLASFLFVPVLAYSLFTYSPIKLLSGLAPPPHYNFFNKDIKEKVFFHDYDKAVEYAKAKNLPLLIDFTGYGCVNCRKMEDQVWSKAVIKPLLDQYVIVSLVTDDREELPLDMQYYSQLSGNMKKINTVGEYWTDFEIKHFRKASQPYYVLSDAQGRILAMPVAYTDADNYEQFLSCGLTNFKKLNKPQ